MLQENGDFKMPVKERIILLCSGNKCEATTEVLSMRNYNAQHLQNEWELFESDLARGWEVKSESRYKIVLDPESLVLCPSCSVKDKEGHWAQQEREENNYFVGTKE